VREVTVGRAVALNATVRSPFALAATNVLTGVVTWTTDAASVDVGDEVYAVSNVPVRVVAGTVPFYRDLVAGAQGDDVHQLQEALRALGHLSSDATGKFDPATTRAVKAWQKALGEEQTGVVPLGRLVAVGDVPSTVRLGDSIVRGGQVQGGEDSVLVRQGAPTFSLVVSDEQSRTIPVDATVTVTFQGHSWPALITGTEAKDGGVVALALSSPDGGPVCGAECGELPADEQATLPAKVQIVPSRTGAGVPSAAVHTDATGATYVLTPSNEKHAVTVLASGDGLAVLEGVAVGEQVLVLAGDEPASEPTTAGG